MRGINAGSGQRRFDNANGWINLDVQRAHPPDVLGSMFQMPFKGGVADYIVSHHTVEHLGCGEATPFIQEAYRVLSPKGKLLAFVPDMQALAQRWLTGQISTYIYMVNVYGAYQGDEADRHKWGYNRASFHRLLSEAAPWTVVKPFDWRHIEGADIAKDWWILGMECIK